MRPPLLPLRLAISLILLPAAMHACAHARLADQIITHGMVWTGSDGDAG